MNRGHEGGAANLVLPAEFDSTLRATVRFVSSVESNRDPRVDRYIAGAAEFSRPILSEIRARVHAGCPAVRETIKWSMPFFTLDDRPLCSMAAFKAHCAFGFWNRRMDAVLAREGMKSEDAMGSLGRIARVGDLPPKRDFGRFMKAAVKLNATGMPGRPRGKSTQRELVIPEDLANGLAANLAAAKAFNEFSYTHRKEYVDWITTAKRAETRARRLATTLEWLADGKPQNWKYGAR